MGNLEAKYISPYSQDEIHPDDAQNPDRIFESELSQVEPGKEYEPTTNAVGISDGRPRWVCVLELEDRSHIWNFFIKRRTKILVFLKPDGTNGFTKYDPKKHGPQCDIPLMETTPAQLSIQIFNNVRKQKGGLSTNALPTEQRPLQNKPPKNIRK